MVQDARFNCTLVELKYGQYPTVQEVFKVLIVP